MKNNKSLFAKAFVIAGAVLCASSVAAWSGPPSSPTTCPPSTLGCNPPINAGNGSEAQTINGGSLTVTNGGALGATSFCLPGSNPSGGCITNWTSAGSASQWTTSSSNIYYTGGNVGVGTASPVNLFQVGNSASNLNIGFGIPSSGVVASIFAAQDSNNTQNGISLALGTNNASTSIFLQRITQYVGVGTTNPQEELDLGGTGWISAQDSVLNNSNNATGITWYYPNPTAYGIYQTSGTWSSPSWQQLEIQYQTGIVLDPGSAGGKNYVDIPEGGLHIDSGSIRFPDGTVQTTAAGGGVYNGHSFGGIYAIGLNQNCSNAGSAGGWPNELYGGACGCPPGYSVQTIGDTMGYAGPGTGWVSAGADQYICYK
jgi:hypothetical protein